jgi:hypothetical protein
MIFVFIKNRNMKSQKVILLISKVYVLLSAFSLLSVSIMAFQNPQAVMDLVAVKLTNPDAYSSIRGVYGGVGVTIFISLLYTMRKNLLESLGLLTIFWGLYAVSRIMTIFNEGRLGAFGNQWLMIEVFFCGLAVLLLLLNRRTSAKDASARALTFTPES